MQSIWTTSTYRLLSLWFSNQDIRNLEHKHLPLYMMYEKVVCRSIWNGFTLYIKALGSPINMCINWEIFHWCIINLIIAVFSLCWHDLSKLFNNLSYDWHTASPYLDKTILNNIWVIFISFNKDEQSITGMTLLSVPESLHSWQWDLATHWGKTPHFH